MRRVFLLTLLLALPLAGPTAAFGQQPAAAGTPAFETLLPADTFLVASIPDVSSTCDQLSRTALGELFREPEMQQFLKPAFQFFEEKLAKAEKKMKYPIRDVMNLFHRQLGVAVVEFDPMLEGLVPDAVLYADLGDHKAEFQKMLASLEEDAGGRIAVEQKEQNGFAWTQITLPIGLDVSLAYFGNAMVVTTRSDRMVAIADVVKSGKPAGLTENPVYQAALAKVGGSGAWLNAFVNVEAILGHFKDQIDALAGPALDASGLAGLKALSMGSSFTAEGIRDSFFAYAPGEKKGLLKLFYTAPGEGPGLLARVPKSAFYASTCRFDLDKMVDIVLEMVDKVQPGAVDQAKQGLAQMRGMLGIDLRDDLLKPLGDQMALYASLPRGGGFIPDVVFLAKLDDPARIENALAQLVARARMMVEDNHRYAVEHRTMDFMGKTIHYVHVAQKRGDPFPVTPSFLVDGDLLVVALFPQPLKDFIANGEKGPSILDRPDFKRVMKGLPSGMESLEYVDLGAGFRWLYGTMVPVLQAVGKHQKCPVDPALLPQTETVAKHLFGAAWGMTADDDGIGFHAYSEFGVLPMVAMMAAPVALMSAGRPFSMHRSIGRARVREAQPHRATPERVQPKHPPKTAPKEAPKAAPAAGNVRGKLKEIYIALLYQYAESSAYPENLGALVESKALESADSLLLPGDEAPLATGGGLKSSFAYVGPKIGMLRKDSDKAIWVYQRDGLGGGARWVLFADGSVRRVPEQQFAELLAATRKMLGK